ncbi:putative leucine-rich repeat domain superfamily [Septoria linicola]|nr:putative leucine-rich repeat domain superfamily [Septoria linicola]
MDVLASSSADDGNGRITQLQRLPGELIEAIALFTDNSRSANKDKLDLLALRLTCKNIEAHSRWLRSVGCRCINRYQKTFIARFLKSVCAGYNIRQLKDVLERPEFAAKVQRLDLIHDGPADDSESALAAIIHLNPTLKVFQIHGGRLQTWESDWLLGDWPSRLLQSARLPMLGSLSLRNVVISSESLKDLLMSYAPTLRCLELCSIEPRDGSPADLAVAIRDHLILVEMRLQGIGHFPPSHRYNSIPGLNGGHGGGVDGQKWFRSKTPQTKQCYRFGYNWIVASGVGAIKLVLNRTLQLAGDQRYDPTITEESVVPSLTQVEGRRGNGLKHRTAFLASRTVRWTY